MPTEELWESGNQKGLMLPLVLKMAVMAFFSSLGISLAFPLLGETRKGVTTSTPHSYFLINYSSLGPGLLSHPLGNCQHPCCPWVSFSFQSPSVGVWTPHPPFICVLKV